MLIDKNFLMSNGYFFTSNINKQQALDIVVQFGHVISCETVTQMPKSPRIVHSIEPMPFHNDHPHCKWIIWWCEKSSDKSERTYIQDSYAILANWQQDDLIKLSKATCIYPTLNNALDKFASHYIWNLMQKNIYYCPWYKAHDEDNICDRLDKEIQKTRPKEEFSFMHGDLLIIDNHRILHSRSPLLKNSKRKLLRWWIK